MLFKVIYSLWLSGTALGGIFSSEEGQACGRMQDAGADKVQDSCLSAVIDTSFEGAD